MPRVEKLHSHLGQLGAEGAEVLARQCGTSPQYLKLIALGHKSASPQLAVAIEKHTGCAVTRVELCPAFDWEYLSRNPVPDVPILNSKTQ